MVKVPWFVDEGDTRKRFVAGEAGQQHVKKCDDLDDQDRDPLSQLGYP